MLSYIVPQQQQQQQQQSEEKIPPRSLNLNHNLNLSAAAAPSPALDISGTTTSTTTRKMLCDETTKLLSNERAQIAKNSNNFSDNKNNVTVTTITKQLQLNILDKNIVSGPVGDGEGSGQMNIESGIDDTISDDICGANTNISGQQTKKTKLSKVVGAKNTTLKRVSFGSSKGSMVETLIFETPTPLPEHAERVFGYPSETTLITQQEITIPSSQQQQQQQQQHRILSNNSNCTLKTTIGASNNNNINNNNNNNNSCLDDSGIDLQEELERSKVRVTFFQSNKPQQVSPPDSYLFYSDSSLPLLPDSNLLLDNSGKTVLPSEMAVETTAQISYDRQISTESGWDNPFRPGGDLSREADEIVNLIKGGKPITPTGDASQSIANGNAQTDLASRSIENGKAVVDGATKTEASHLQSTPAQNGTKTSQSKSSNDPKSATQTQVSNQVIPGPTSASHVVIQDKKKKKCNCCVIQ